jgi:hypothetical protein
MNAIQDVRRYRAGRRVRLNCTRPVLIDGGGLVLVRRSSAESGTGAGGEDRAAPPAVSSPQQRAALYGLAYAYGALLRAQHPEYDWVIEVQE